MHFHIVDAYQETDSLLHRTDARVKVMLAFVMILLIALTPMGAFGAYVGFFAIAMAGVVVARVDPLTVLKRSLVALPFAGAAVSLIFTMPGPSLGTVPLLGWSLSAAGVIRFASIVFKSFISVQFAVLMMLTTHFADVLWALSALHVPRVLVVIFSFMYRYLFVLADEALRLTRARDSRSAAIGGSPAAGRSIVFRAQTTGRMIGNLFLRSFDRSERVYQAMAARGYRGEIRQLDTPPLVLRDVAVGIIALLLGLGLTVASMLFR
ncbi:MAG: cobalt ECF transporter T component CbiQ [Anaerolineae bacterium]|nr:cobalt ECF transporter T component CbiQ [Anaerolineae bacterium]